MPCVIDFFFQAEDGIRDLTVTGVQTCALPIYTIIGSSIVIDGEISGDEDLVIQGTVKGKIALKESLYEIGRASCRERCRFRWSFDHYYVDSHELAHLLQTNHTSAL